MGAKELPENELKRLRKQVLILLDDVHSRDALLDRISEYAETEIRALSSCSGLTEHGRGQLAIFQWLRAEMKKKARQDGGPTD